MDKEDVVREGIFCILMLFDFELNIIFYGIKYLF